MDYTKKHFFEYNPHDITIVDAEEQTQGRGRFGRKWISPKGKNIYATFYFRLDIDQLHLCSLAQLMTLSTARVLLQEEVEVEIKWPNDILVQNQKIAGVLCETKLEKSHIDIFLGLGINLDIKENILKAIEKPASSLEKQTNRAWEKEDLLNKIIHQFIDDLKIFKKQGFSPFLNALDNLLAYKGQTIICTDGKNTYEGICHSLNSEGMLNLYLPEKKLLTLHSAEVSLKRL